MHFDKQSQIIIGKMQQVISDLVRENYELNERLEIAAKEKADLKYALEIQNQIGDGIRSAQNKLLKENFELKDIIGKMIEESLEVDPYF